MKSPIPSLFAASLLVIPSVLAQDRPAAATPSRENARMEQPPEDRPERREPQRRERPQTEPSAPSRPGPPAQHRSPGMEREHRVVMERIDRMERASQERDARLARVVRELSARIDRVEQAPAKRPAPARGSETVKPMEDEKLRMAVQEVEERMKRVHEMEKKLGERAADLKKTEEKLNERERELRQMAERLKANAVKPDAREKSKPKRETGRSPRKNKDRERDGE